MVAKVTIVGAWKIAQTIVNESPENHLKDLSVSIICPHPHMTTQHQPFFSSSTQNYWSRSITTVLWIHPPAHDTDGGIRRCPSIIVPTIVARVATVRTVLAAEIVEEVLKNEILRREEVRKTRARNGRRAENLN